MNSADRKLLYRAMRCLRTIDSPGNPADIKGHVQGLRRAKKIAREVVSAIEFQGYGEPDLALESIEAAEAAAGIGQGTDR